MTVGELVDVLLDMPQDAEVYINSYNEEKKAETVGKSLAYGLFECVEIS